MNFLDKLSALLPIGQNSAKPEYYFALNIDLNQVTAVAWSIFNHKVDVLGEASSEYEGTEELITKGNQVLDEALGALEVEPDQILFGVPESWSLDDNLKEPYLKLLKRMVSEYGLEPLAYVTITHAISHLLQKQEGVPPTAILLGIGDFVESTLVRGGKIIESKHIKRSERIFDEIEKTAAQFTEVEVLPSKILLYSTKKDQNLSKIKEDLMSFPWMQRLPFLHFPKIEVLPENITYEALILAGAVEIDPQLDFKHSFVVKKAAPTAFRKFDHQETTSPKVIGDGGFVTGDIKHKQASSFESKQSFSTNRLSDENLSESEIEEIEDLESDNLLNPDLEEEISISPAYRKIHPNVRSNDTALGMAHPHPMPEHHQNEPHPKSRLPAIFSFLPIGKDFSTFLPSSFPLALFLIPIILLILGASYILFTKAEATIFVEPKILEKNAQIIADPKLTEVNVEKNMIPAEVVKTSVNGSTKGIATGTKEIGDPAKGKIIIYNKTNQPKSFSQGTVVTDSKGLKFTLDNSVQVASQSSSIGPDFTTIIKPGKSDAVNVTAVAIGSDGNLAAGTELAVAGFDKSQVVATIDAAFSGGTSQKVTIVTSEDQKKFRAQLLDELKQKAKEQLQSEITEDKKIITDALVASESKFTFSKAVSDQAKDFNVDAKVEFTGTAYKDSDLKSIVGKLVETNVPEGFEFNLADTETSAEVSEIKENGVLVFTAKFKARILPKLNIEQIKEEIKGKGVKEVGNKLKDMEHVIGSEIKLSPNYPAPFNRLPFLTKNIEVKVTPK